MRDVKQEDRRTVKVPPKPYGTLSKADAAKKAAEAEEVKQQVKTGGKTDGSTIEKKNASS